MADIPKKPEWLKVRLPGGPNYARIDRYHRKDGLHTVCRSAACPNQGECWNRGTATFMILGNRCTRNCAFCNVSAAPPFPPAHDEPEKIARAVAELHLKHVVITSVTRDDLPDGGAEHFARTIYAIRNLMPNCRIELLIPDLGGNHLALKTILDAEPDILGHNIETVPRLYNLVREGASYERSLALHATARRLAPRIRVKSGIMVGLGEEIREIGETMKDILEAGCSMLTIGQYLAPTKNHAPVRRFYTPEEFESFRIRGLELGFSHIESGPLVRSSFHAQEQFDHAVPLGQSVD